MGDGWTGINADEVRGQLQAFADAMTELGQTYCDAFDLFNDELYRAWASEKAVEFNKRLAYLAQQKANIYWRANTVLSAATTAARFMAKHNGAEFNFEINVGEKSDSYVNLEAEKNGVKGMNIPLAKLSLESFSNTVEQVIAGMEALPLDFGLYDPAGELKACYSEMMQDKIFWLRSETQTSVNQMKTAFEEESLNVQLGKTQAEQQLAA